MFTGFDLIFTGYLLLIIRDFLTFTGQKKCNVKRILPNLDRQKPSFELLLLDHQNWPSWFCNTGHRQQKRLFLWLFDYFQDYH